MRYPQRIVVSQRPAGVTAGVQVAGVWTPDTSVLPVVLYDGPCDVQDKPKVLKRDKDGVNLLVADATVFLPSGTRVATWDLGVLVVVTWADGSTSDGKVVETRRLDTTCYLQWLAPVGS